MMWTIPPGSPKGNAHGPAESVPAGRALHLCFGNWLWTVVIALLCTLLVARLSPVLTTPEFGVLDELLSRRPARPPDPRIVLVGVSRADADKHEQERSEKPPPGQPDLQTCACALIPRNEIGEVITKAKQHGARVVVLDLSLEQTCPLPGHDAGLAKALDEGPGETILAERADPTPETSNFVLPPSVFLGTQESRLLASPVLFNPYGTVRGVELIQVGTPSTVAQEEAEKQGIEMVGETFPPLCLAAYTAFRGDPCEVPVPTPGGTVTCCDTPVPVWAGEHIYLMEPFMPRPEHSMYIMLINWAGPAGTLPMLDLEKVRGETSAARLDAWFRGNIVIVGSAAERLNTPMPRASLPPAGVSFIDQSRGAAMSGMSGLEAHGEALNTLLQHRFLRPLSLPAVWAILFGCCLLTSLAFLRLSLVWAIAAAVVQVVLLLQAERILLRSDLWVYTVIPSLGITLSAASAGLWGYARSRHEAEELAEEVEVHDSRTATLAHDLKQPLAAISGLAAAIRATQQTEQAAVASPELVQRIQRQVEGALADIDDMLMTAPGREVSLRPQRFDLAALARGLAASQSLKSSVHDVEVRTSAEEIWIEADPRYLGRALSNLVDNAIKYWPEGGTVVVEVLAGPGRAQVRVTDGGLGMSPEQQSRIFERFRRAVPDHAGIPGSGLGLYSVKRIADAHGGSIAVQSKAGAGSTFILTIPALPRDHRGEGL
jgi:signal transduction histidine kinase